MFKVFSTQIYSDSILSILTFSRARYIATSYGFAATRIFFNTLYSRFAGPSIYVGMCNVLILRYSIMSIWIYQLIYFWLSLLPLYVAHFSFNPYQFLYGDFIIDYWEFLH